MDNRLPNVNLKKSQNGMGMLLLFGLAALALGQALQDRDGFLSVSALGWLSVALLCACAGAISQKQPYLQVSKKVFWVVLLSGLVWQLYQLLSVLPSINIMSTSLHGLWQFRSSIVVAGVCALLSVTPKVWFNIWLRRGMIAAVFLAVLTAGVWIIRASPNPWIDVFMFQRISSQALLQGHNPYELTPPNIYGDLGVYAYGSALINNNGELTVGNPYPPLSIFLSLLGYAIAGDIRYSCLAAILITGAIIIILHPGREALLAAYLFLFTPRVFYVLELSWTEPLALLLVVVVVWCAIYHPTWKFVTLGLLLAIKQYFFFLFPVFFLLIPMKSSRRIWAHAISIPVGVAFTVTAPLAFWNFPAFLWNVGLAQWYQIFRVDSLSYAAAYAKVTGQWPITVLPFIMLGLGILFAWRYCDRSPAGFATAMAIGLTLFFAFNKQAFCNYYFLVIGILCCAMAAIPNSDSKFKISLE